MFTDVIVVTTDILFFSEFTANQCGNHNYIQIEAVEEASEHCSKIKQAVIVIDIERIKPQELNYTSYLHQRFPDISIIIITPLSMVDEANRAIESGASLYLTKPIDCRLIQQTIDREIKSGAKKVESAVTEEQMLFDLMGGSKSMDKVLKLVVKVAPSSSTILLGGENGTGKEYFATIIHKLSRVKGNFIPVNCGAIPDNLFESEMFGHQKGSFTGASRDRAGLVEEAEGGTLFLDEVAELSMAAQVKLLRFLQDKKFKPVGDNLERKVNTRIIAATNKNLKELVKSGEFREDLYYRLHVFPITLPPLRERKESIPNLVTIFIHRANEKTDTSFTGFSQAAEFILSQHNYPGNIRELENIVEHTTIMATPPLIRDIDLPEYLFKDRKRIEDKSDAVLSIEFSDEKSEFNEEIDSTTSEEPFICGTDKTIEELEQAYINQVLEENSNNHSKAAKSLGISRSTLWRKLKTGESDGN
jgi:DNA-binding NtrC family response regulator